MKKTLKIIGLAVIAGGLFLGSGAADPRSAPFRQALPDYSYRFPRDFFSHDDFRIEWWYYTGNLVGPGGRPFGYQLTFFRVALEDPGKNSNPSRWKVDQVYFAHMTVSDLAGGKFHFFERINRKGLDNAGAASDRLHVWNEDWTLTAEENAHRLSAVDGGTGLDLHLVPVKELVTHGMDGISRKGSGEGNASHYFSYTRMRTSGKVFLNGETFEVRGTSWMDHEFSSNPLNGDLVGWDWFSLKLDNHTEVMIYRLRRKDGSIDPFSSGTLVLADDSSRHLGREEFSVADTGSWTSRRSNATYPAGWVVSLPGHDTRLTVTPDLDDQELYHLRSISSSYWEGSVSVEGTFKGVSVKGKGYVELVGYQKALVQELPE
ncbi:MAG: lipocalin-like domain-containing protein [Nitrospinaceae bacterium]